MQDEFEFPSANDWGIPDLLPSRQPVAVAHPLRCWGSTAQVRHRDRGGWHCYTDDRRFSVLLREPWRLTDTEPLQAVEPNVSILPETPRAVAIERVYRKRRAARYWQACGVVVFVDLYVPEHHQDLNLLGVPRGWAAYATRGADRRMEDLDSEFAVARRHAGGDVLFLVVGGGVKVHRWCRESGAVHHGYKGTRRVHSHADVTPGGLRSSLAVAGR